MTGYMPQSLVSADLIGAYRAAEYRVDSGSASFCFRVHESSPELARLLRETGQACAFFITAHNPFSEPQAAPANRAANERLRCALEALTDHVFAAAGVDATGGWPPEPGFLALGVPAAAARSVGREFRQNAVVWIGADAVPQLMLLR